MEDPASARPRATVLVIEDDRWQRDALSQILSTEGYRVLEASNGKSGLRLALAQRCDLILLDLALPELSGFAVLRDLASRPLTRNIPVIVLSGLLHALVAEELDRAAAVLSKPFDWDALLAHVERALDRPPVHPPRLRAEAEAELI